MSVQKATRSEDFFLTEEQPSRTVVVNEGEEYFNLSVSTFSPPLQIMLIAKGKVTCIPFIAGDRDSCYELQQAEKIVISIGSVPLPVSAGLTMKIW